MHRYQRKRNNIKKEISQKSKTTTMASKIIIVTGGNSGIGYETVKKILQSNKAKYHVFLGARTPEYVFTSHLYASLP